ncbi:hypothetical protein CDD80_5916 [Ophiocordyceps camponoti-rufipedis]|uniref:Uncharacterized protein n=1 Tax=Ophiocordyceps camponoti-rufipedis TaxID=2004952 RepID=A0A2C5ZAS8_9HYPO|nr:hypothetical protein CDD80_5916 [Ophiocordyceps camponoti-rufipedis]
MPWLKKTRASSPARHDEGGGPHVVLPGKRLMPTAGMSGYQFFYMFVLDGVGGLILSGGINFAIAYGLYKNTKDPVRLFQLPNTLAGDGAVTIFVQCLITWLIETMLVTYDVNHGSVRTIGWIREPRNRLLRSFFLLPVDPLLGAPPPTFFGFTPIIQFIIRGLLFGVASFFLFWPICVGILAGIGERRPDGDYYYDNVWTPQVYKLLLGGLLGLVTGPPMAMFWLVRYGWEAQTAIRCAEEAAVRYAEEEAARVGGQEGVSSPAFSRPSEDARKAAGSRGDVSKNDDGKPSEEVATGSESDIEDDKPKQLEASTEVRKAAESDTASGQGESADQDRQSSAEEVEASGEGILRPSTEMSRPFHEAEEELAMEFSSPRESVLRPDEAWHEVSEKPAPVRNNELRDFNDADSPVINDMVADLESRIKGSPVVGSSGHGQGVDETGAS